MPHAQVPLEPTEEMLRAALDCQDADPADDYKTELYHAYKAMLAARPAAAQEAVAWKVIAKGGKFTRGLYEKPTEQDFEIWRLDGDIAIPLYLHAPAAPGEHEPSLDDFDYGCNDCGAIGDEPHKPECPESASAPAGETAQPICDPAKNLMLGASNVVYKRRATDNVPAAREDGLTATPLLSSFAAQLLGAFYYLFEDSEEVANLTYKFEPEEWDKLTSIIESVEYVFPDRPGYVCGYTDKIKYAIEKLEAAAVTPALAQPDEGLADLVKRLRKYAIEPRNRNCGCRARRDALVLEAAAALSRRGGEGWQPIETAPKDGKHILLSDGEKVSEGGWISDVDQGAEYEGQLHCACWWSVDCIEHPTHWQPLPTPPSAPQNGGA